MKKRSARNSDLFRKTLNPSKRYWSMPKLVKNYVHVIVLLDGSTRIPNIQNRLALFLFSLSFFPFPRFFLWPLGPLHQEEVSSIMPRKLTFTLKCTGWLSAYVLNVWDCLQDWNIRSISDVGVLVGYNGTVVGTMLGVHNGTDDGSDVGMLVGHCSDLNFFLLRIKTTGRRKQTAVQN